MIIVAVVLAVLALGALMAWGVMRADVPGVPPAVGTQSAQPLPAGPVRSEDVHDLRFDQTVRGYQMAQVDDALSRLAAELAERDALIARWQEERGEGREELGAAGTGVPGRPSDTGGIAP